MIYVITIGRDSLYNAPINLIVALGRPARNTSNALECGFCWNRMGNRGHHQE